MNWYFYWCCWRLVIQLSSYISNFMIKLWRQEIIKNLFWDGINNRLHSILFLLALIVLIFVDESEKEMMLKGWRLWIIYEGHYKRWCKFDILPFFVLCLLWTRFIIVIYRFFIALLITFYPISSHSIYSSFYNFIFKNHDSIFFFVKLTEK